MTAFAVMVMFFVGLGIGAWASAYYFQVVSPDRVRVIRSHLEAAWIAEDVSQASAAAQQAMKDAAAASAPAAPVDDEHNRS